MALFAQADGPKHFDRISLGAGLQRLDRWSASGASSGASGAGDVAFCLDKIVMVTVS